MSDEAAKAPAKKKGGKKKLVMMALGGLLLAGGGAGAGMYATGIGLSGGKHEAKVDPDAPKLVKREGAAEHGDDGARPSAAHGAKPDMSQYKATYYPVEQSFTSNLRDSDGFAQVGLGVATYYDQKVLDNIKDNEMPIRSAVLMVLADQEAMVLSTPGGKAALQERLTKTINDVLEQKTGFGGVDSVYFTSFIIQ